jgi:hypothetical protein
MNSDKLTILALFVTLALSVVSNFRPLGELRASTAKIAKLKKKNRQLEYSRDSLIQIIKYREYNRVLKF